MKLSDMPVLDTPQGMALLRVLNDNVSGDGEPLPLPTNYLLAHAMKRTRAANTVIVRVQYLRALERLTTAGYVRQDGAGLESSWSLTKHGRRAAVEGAAIAGQPIQVEPIRKGA